MRKLEVAGALALAVVLGAGGCGGGSSSPGTCSSQGGLQILFSPMYTAWDMEHRFQIPAVVKGVDPTKVTWSASDPSLVSLSPDPSTGGIMITVTQANPKLMVAGPAVTVNIQATSGSLCGSSVLTITPTGEEDDWHDGALRYNNGVDARPPQTMSCAKDSDCPSGENCVEGQCALKTAACTNCHGPTATNGPYNDVSHTPEQIGGFTNADLDDIIRNGVVPAGGYFDPTIVSMDKWHELHQWKMTDEELRGLIIYLRSLTPAPQKGTANFGGSWGSDGGM